MATVEELREQVLSLIALEKAHDCMGIYPQSVKGCEGAYEKRTERMEGWNDYGMKLSEKRNSISRWMESIPTEYKEDIEDLIIEDRIYLSVLADGIAMMVNCNDLFYWACADMEPFEFSDLANFKKAKEEAPKHGDILWCCRKRGMRPQRPHYKYFDESEKVLFDAAGPERTGCE